VVSTVGVRIDYRLGILVTIVREADFEVVDLSFRHVVKRLIGSIVSRAVRLRFRKRLSS